MKQARNLFTMAALAMAVATATACSMDVAPADEAAVVYENNSDEMLKATINYPLDSVKCRIK